VKIVFALLVLLRGDFVDYIHINKLITTSIYKQIATSIKEAINAGKLTYNDRLPTEKEICQTFSISQTAVKMAYEELIKDQLIVRIKGKGTYVTNRQSYHNNMNHFYENELFLNHQSEYQQQVILFDKKCRDYSAKRVLKLKDKEACYYISRVIYGQGNPKVYQKIYLPKKFFKSFEKVYHDFKNLYTFIEQGFGLNIKHMHNTFTAVNASSSEALLLNIKPDDAIYYVRSKIIDEKDRVVGYVTHFFPGEFTEFEVIVHAI
jgi:GntR family transcriptional regulator